MCVCVCVCVYIYIYIYIFIFFFLIFFLLLFKPKYSSQHIFVNTHLFIFLWVRNIFFSNTLFIYFILFVCLFIYLFIGPTGQFVPLLIDNLFYFILYFKGAMNQLLIDLLIDWLIERWFTIITVAIHICFIYSLNWVIIYNGVMELMRELFSVVIKHYITNACLSTALVLNP